MTLRLILIRHAKSSWDDPTTEDHDRPLNKRGRGAAADIGQWLGSRGLVPGQILCSTAMRATETLEGIAAAMGPGLPKAERIEALYHATPETMLEVLNRATAPVVMMIGHNPGLALFARALLSHPPALAAFDRYPTGATTVIEFAGDDWSKVGWEQGGLAEFMTPREIA